MRENRESDAKAKPKIDTDYRKTRPKRLNKFEKIDGMKAQRSDWIERERTQKPNLIRATTAKGRRIAIREMQGKAAK